jgi:hypothetical protein
MARIRIEGLAATRTGLTAVFLSRRGWTHQSRVEPVLQGSVLNAVWSYRTVGAQGSRFAYKKQRRQMTDGMRC